MKKKYTIELAKEVQEKFNIPDATLRTWKNRGYIPSKFFKKNYSKSKVVENNATTEKIRSILKFEEVASSKFRAFEGNRSFDVLSKKLLFRENEIITLKDEIVELRNLLRKCMKSTSTKNLKALSEDRRLMHSKILGRSAYAYFLQMNHVDKYEDEVKLNVSALYNRIRI